LDIDEAVPTGEPSVTVRPATREDIPGIVQAALTSLSEGEDEGFGARDAENSFEDVSRLATAWQEPNLVRGEMVTVAELDGDVVGYVTTEDRGEALELINIDVMRAHQGRGIGTRLVRFVEERAREAGKQAVTLGTSRNAAGVPWKSLPWWTHQGYRVTHEEENAWTRAIGPGAREIRMRKDLPREDNIALRAIRPEDLPTLFEHQRDPVAVQMAAFTVKDPTDWAAFSAHWTRILADPTVTMRAVLSDGCVVGSVGSFVDKDSGHTEVTYWIGRGFWGQGLATRALSLFLEQMKLRPIYARAAQDNVASLRVLEKCGFRRIGTARGWANARSGETDEVIMELLAPPASNPGKA
jgi:RimJ/RimL family protein N-acetyltransferase